MFSVENFFNPKPRPHPTKKVDAGVADNDLRYPVAGGLKKNISAQSFSRVDTIKNCVTMFHNIVTLWNRDALTRIHCKFKKL